MSENGSFVTEYIYCKKCFEGLKKILLANEKFLCSEVIKGWGENKFLPIIAGKIGGCYSGEELHTFEYEFNEKLALTLCHPVRIAVLAEDGEQIFTIQPKYNEVFNDK